MISYEYKKDKSWTKPHKYQINFNDGKEECGWWVTVMDKKHEDKYEKFFDLRIGIDVETSCLHTKHDVKNTGLGHKDIIKLMTKGLTREMAFEGKGMNYWIFNLTTISTNALYNYLKDVKGMTNEEIIMTGDAVHYEFLVPGIIEKLELSDEMLLKIGKTCLITLKEILPKTEFDRLFSDKFIIECLDLKNYTFKIIQARGLEKQAFRKAILKEDNIGKVIKDIKKEWGFNDHMTKCIEEVELELLLKQ